MKKKATAVLPIVTMALAAVAFFVLFFVLLFYKNEYAAVYLSNPQSTLSFALVSLLAIVIPGVFVIFGKTLHKEKMYKVALLIMSTLSIFNIFIVQGLTESSITLCEHYYGLTELGKYAESLNNAIFTMVLLLSIPQLIFGIISIKNNKINVVRKIMNTIFIIMLGLYLLTSAICFTTYMSLAIVFDAIVVASYILLVVTQIKSTSITEEVPPSTVE